jgi:hypothetical protein
MRGALALDMNTIRILTSVPHVQADGLSSGIVMPDLWQNPSEGRGGFLPPADNSVTETLVSTTAQLVLTAQLCRSRSLPLRCLDQRTQL